MAEWLRDGWLPRQARRAWHCLAGGGWRLALCRVLVVLALVGFGGLLFAAAGLVPIAASEGHWAVTRALLQFTMRSAVRTSTLGVQAPPLDDPGLVLKGAGHYASSCMPCHGAPGVARDLVVMQMTPKPPYLPHGTGTLRDEELFWIVKHGIKYTAMPAWPAPLREDEVWAMVAFLRVQPGMSPERFRALAFGDRGDARTDDALLGPAMSPVLANCERCHGEDGMGRGDGAVPRLAGLDEAYLLASLQAFASGRRHSGIMQPVAARLGVGERRALAAHFSSLGDGGSASCTAPEPRDRAAIARGATLAAQGDPRRKIPACIACHRPGEAQRHPLYPALAGQHADYLALQLRLFRDDRRGGTPRAGLMRAAADRLEARDIRDLAAYYSVQPAGNDGASPCAPTGPS